MRWRAGARTGAAIAALLAVAPALAHAHTPRRSYLSVATGGAELGGRWDIALADLDVAIGLDSDANG